MPDRDLNLGFWRQLLRFLVIAQITNWLIIHFRPEWLNLSARPYISFLNSPWQLLIATLLFFTLWYWLGAQLSLPFILMGAGLLSNILDYLVYGHFIDYIFLPWWQTNLADIYVVGGCIWLLLTLLTSRSSQNESLDR